MIMDLNDLNNPANPLSAISPINPLNPQIKIGQVWQVVALGGIDPIYGQVWECSIPTVEVGDKIIVSEIVHYSENALAFSRSVAFSLLKPPYTFKWFEPRLRALAHLIE
jgi:hypothetical protein